MQITNNTYTQVNEDIYKNTLKEDALKNENKSQKTVDIEEEMNKSAVQVSISMNAQIILFAMDSKNLAQNNTEAQNNIFNFLSGKEVEGQLSLSDLGYEGKPITELSQEEAQELISDEGFFGVDQTSQRVADFVFSFSDDLETIEKAREGIVQGFEEANELWGGELPEISHETQKRTLELIDERIAEMIADFSEIDETTDELIEDYIQEA